MCFWEKEVIKTLFPLVMDSEYPYNTLSWNGSTELLSPIPGPGEDILNNHTMWLRACSKLSFNSGRLGARAKLFHQESNNLLTKMIEVKYACKINTRSVSSDTDERVG